MRFGRKLGQSAHEVLDWTSESFTSIAPTTSSAERSPTR
jgi:hypothetical protein